MPILSYIIWSINPDIFYFPGSSHPLRWYGLLFAGGFIISQQIMYYIYEKEGKSKKDIDTLTAHMIIATLVGARLGHVLFYGPWWDSFDEAGRLISEGYFHHPLKILAIWEGGLASHGGAIGILISIWLFVKYDISVKIFPIIKGYLGIPTKITSKRKDREGQSYLYVLDRLVIVISLTGAMIRMGNFTNSEMIGIPTESEYGMIFAREAEVAFLGNKAFESIEFTTDHSREAIKPGYVPIKIKFHYKRNPYFDEKSTYEYFQNNVKNYLVKERKVNHLYHPKDQKLPVRIYSEKKHYVVEASIYGINRHPAQLYEAFYCLMLFFGLFYLWYKYRHQLPVGLLFAIFLIVLWGLRFVDEYFKINQVPFEDNLPLNMGQWLSIPFVLVGIILMIWSLKKGKKPAAN